MPILRLKFGMFFVIATFLIAIIQPASADDKADAESLVNKSLTTFNDFKADPDMTWFQNHLGQAQGIMIVPRLLKGGFIFGGSGGSGVLLKREQSGNWIGPAFYAMGSVSWGLQAGAEAAEVILLIMSQKGLDSLLSTKVQLGADVSVAAGPVGAGAQAATVDILQFSRTKGIFGGLTLEGSVITPRDGLMNAYYGKPMTPVNILVTKDANNPQSDTLRVALIKGAD